MYISYTISKIHIRRFPEMGVPPNRPFIKDFPLQAIHFEVAPFLGTPIYIYTYIYIHNVYIYIHTHMTNHYITIDQYQFIIINLIILPDHSPFSTACRPPLLSPPPQAPRRQSAACHRSSPAPPTAWRSPSRVRTCWDMGGKTLGLYHEKMEVLPCFTYGK